MSSILFIIILCLIKVCVDSVWKNKEIYIVKSLLLVFDINFEQVKV